MFLLEVYRIVQLLKKCPVSEFVNIFKACGLDNEVSAIPKSLKKQKILSRPLVKLYQHGVEAAREALCHIVDVFDPLTKKRKSEAEDVDTTGIAQKDINKIVKKLDCTKQQAVKWLREKNLDVEECLWRYGRQINMKGFAEDVE